MSALKPCPFCGGQDFDYMLDGGMHVMCNDCGTTGPNGDTCTTDAAIAAWNRRAGDNEVEKLRAEQDSMQATCRKLLKQVQERDAEVDALRAAIRAAADAIEQADDRADREPGWMPNGTQTIVEFLRAALEDRT